MVNVIVVFLRAPEKGRVKTRLAGAVGDDAALGLYRAFVEKTLAAVKRAAVACRIYFHPPDRQARVQAWLGEAYTYAPQAGEDLGRRMANALAAEFDRGAGRAVLVGTDIPQVRSAHFHRAFQLLAERDAVLGPSEDGGYWLIGFTAAGFTPRVFEGVEWSTDRVCRATLDRMADAGLSVGLLPELRDIDTLADLNAVPEAYGIYKSVEALKEKPPGYRG